MAWQKSSGIAMLIVLSFIMLFVVLAAAAMMLSTAHFGTSFRQIHRARALYAAEAALQQALWMCRNPGQLFSASGGCDLDNGCGGVWPITNTIVINDPNYSVTVNIEIFPEGSDPTGTGKAAPEDVFPIIAKVTY